MKQYMIIVTLPSDRTEEFISLIPEQRTFIEVLVKRGIITSYSLAEDRSVIWTVINAKSKRDATGVLAKFPLAKYVKFEIKELAFNVSANLKMPALSLN